MARAPYHNTGSRRLKVDANTNLKSTAPLFARSAQEKERKEGKNGKRREIAKESHPKPIPTNLDE